jgi:hypothetical protein
VAKFGSRPTSFGTGGTVLTANVAAGSTLANLSSMVNPSNTLSQNTTPAAWVTGTGSIGSALYGAVGSEADILASTALAANATISMQWRQRSPGEAKSPTAAAGTTLPHGAWLASDVVQIGGATSGVSYALQMTFDNRINLALGGSAYDNLANECSNLDMVELNTATNQWVNAATTGALGVDAQQGVSESLSAFLVNHSTDTLAQLQGSWGVDPTATNQGIGHSWAIVAGGGSGVFAVDPSSLAAMSGSNFIATSLVPEPSSLALLIAAALGLLALGFRRWTRASR